MYEQRQHLRRSSGLQPSSAHKPLTSTVSLPLSTSKASSSMRIGLGNLRALHNSLSLPPNRSVGPSEIGHHGDVNSESHLSPAEIDKQEDRAAVQEEWDRYYKDGIIKDEAELQLLDLVPWWQVCDSTLTLHAHCSQLCLNRLTLKNIPYFTAVRLTFSLPRPRRSRASVSFRQERKLTLYVGPSSVLQQWRYCRF